MRAHDALDAAPRADVRARRVDVAKTTDHY
jgi:hypothetical protein